MLPIAITKSTTANYPLYPLWLKQSDPDLDCTDLEIADDPVGALHHCAGLVLAGGPDVDPDRFGKSDDSDVCTVDPIRDAREFACIEAALRLGLPILGICRGLQIMNVALGGSLVTDLPSASISGHGKSGSNDSMHGISLEAGSLLHSCTGALFGTVNSSHHQSADVAALELRISAWSDDGVVEAMEWKHPEGKPFLLLVQWHPERMPEPDDPFSKKIADAFMREVLSFASL